VELFCIYHSNAAKSIVAFEGSTAAGKLRTADLRIVYNGLNADKSLTTFYPLYDPLIRSPHFTGGRKSRLNSILAGRPSQLPFGG